MSPDLRKRPVGGRAENSSEAVLIDDTHHQWTLRGTKKSLHARELQATIGARLRGHAGISRLLGTAIPLLRICRNDIRTTKNYMHVLNRGGRGVRSPADNLSRGPDAR